MPAPPHPRRAQSLVRTKQTTRPPPPSFLSPLTAWPPATSAVHAPYRGSLRGQSAPGSPRGPPGDPPRGIGGWGKQSWLRGVRVAIIQPPPPPLARPARKGGVPSSSRLPALAPAPLPFFSSSRTWKPPGSPGNPRPRARNSAPPAGTGWAPDAPQRRVFAPPAPHAEPRALSPPPTHLARWPSPRGPAPPRQDRRTLFAPVRPPLPASAAWSVRSGGRGRGAGVAAVPEPPPLSRPAPARPSPTRT